MNRSEEVIVLRVLGLNSHPSVGIPFSFCLSNPIYNPNFSVIFCIYENLTALLMASQKTNCLDVQMEFTNSMRVNTMRFSPKLGVYYHFMTTKTPYLFSVRTTCFLLKSSFHLLKSNHFW